MYMKSDIFPEYFKQLLTLKSMSNNMLDIVFFLNSGFSKKMTKNVTFEL